MSLFSNKRAEATRPLPDLQPMQSVTQEDETNRLRPCYARGRKALFHRWVNSAHPVLPRGVEPSENARYFQFRSVTALVEYEDGTVNRVYPNEVQFVDFVDFDQYTWPPVAEGDSNG